MELTCTYYKAVCHDQDRLFLVRPYKCLDFNEIVNDAGLILCSGNVQNYLKGTPLRIQCHSVSSPLCVDSCDEYVVDWYELPGFLKNFRLDDEVVIRLENTIGKDLFRAAVAEDAVQRFEEAGLGQAASVRLSGCIKDFAYKRALIGYLAPYGINSEIAEKLFDAYNHRAMQIVKDNPFVLIHYDVPFSCVDMMDSGPHDSLERLDALVASTLNAAEQSGHTCIPFDKLCSKADRTSRRSRGNAAGISQFETAATVALNKQTVCRMFHYGNETSYRVYHASMDRFEQVAAYHTARLIKSEQVPVLRQDVLRQVEEDLAASYADEQRQAFSLFGGVSVLSGGPGTGKTMTLNGLLQYYDRCFQNKKVALCAPTAAAAKRMRESTGRNAVTVHKLLEVRPNGFGGYTAKDEFDQLDYDMVVVDECSMIDLQLYSMLVSSLKNGAMLLLVGDMDQLPSVGPGNVLADLLRCPEVRRVHLAKVFRQSERSSIVHNSFVIRSGKGKLLFDDNSEIKICKTTDEMLEAAIETMQEHYKPDDPFSCRLIVPSRNPKYPVQTEALNTIFQDMFTASEDFLTSGTRRFFCGDPVVFLRNNYAGGYCNGDIGTVQGTGNGRLVISTEDGPITVTGSNLVDVAPAYATTVHKSQGSECATCVIVLPANPEVLLQRNLLYVASTRARKRNIFIVENKADQTTFGFAMHNTWRANRFSGLLPRIRKCLDFAPGGKEKEYARTQ